MTEPFRTRRFTPIAPGERPHRRRSASRVVIRCADQVLLLADTDPGIPGSRWWFTVGGGIDAGESPEQAALRELGEETGIRIEPHALNGPVATRTVIHGYSDQVLEQFEYFFVVELAEQVIPSAVGFTADEQLTISGWAWHHLSELAALADPVWPASLPGIVDLLADPQRWPVDLGVIEESTVPVGSIG